VGAETENAREEKTLFT